jgi:hypothetical protein
MHHTIGKIEEGKTPGIVQITDIDGVGSVKRIV